MREERRGVKDAGGDGKREYTQKETERESKIGKSGNWQKLKKRQRTY